MAGKILTILALLSALQSAGRDIIHNYKITNASKIALQDAPVVIAIPEIESWVRSATVFVDDNVEVPSQLDDMNGDGKYDELCLVLNFDAGQSRNIWVLFTHIAPVNERYPARVAAQMFLKEDKNIAPKKEICATADNMYNKLHHHGPAFESELVAYRLYFDKKQTTDLYGKYNKGLELAQTLWYPTDAQLAAGAGDDIIRVFNSVGVGTLKGWDPVKKQPTHIEPIARRCARIVATGPVRTVVDMKVDGWEYQGRLINMNSRYVLYAGHRDCQVRNSIQGGDGLMFCTGVMKIARHTSQIRADKGTMATWGTDFPVNDTVKFARQTVGLALYADPWRIKQETQDPANYLFLMTPDNKGNINYRISFASEKETFGYKTDTDFYRYVAYWSLERPLTIKQTK